MNIERQEARLLRFLKDWTLPVAMVVGTVVYLLFAFTPQLDGAGEFFGPIISDIFPLFMFAEFLTFLIVNGEYYGPNGWAIAIICITAAISFVGLYIISRYIIQNIHYQLLKYQFSFL